MFLREFKPKDKGIDDCTKLQYNCTMKKNNLLSELLSSISRSEVFRVLFDGQMREFYFREMERMVSVSASGLKAELAKLIKMDLLVQEKDGNRLYFKANTVHPLYPLIVELVEKTVGIEAVLKQSLETHREIDIAFIFGSVAQNSEKAHSDIDLVVIGEITLRSLVKILSPLQEKFGREINPHVYSHEEFKERIKKKDHFVSSLMKAEKKMIKGNLSDA